MTDTKALKRARNAAGWEHVQGWVKAEDAPQIQERLKTGAEVDESIAAKKGS